MRKLGQIIPRGPQRWLVRVPLGQDHQSGRRRYLNHTVAGPLGAARDYLHSQLLERGPRTGRAEAPPTLNAYLDRWLALAARPRLRSKSFEDYRSLLARSIRPGLGNRLLHSIEPLDLQTVYERMREGGLSARTIHYTHAVLHSALEQAIGWRLLRSNPAAGVALPKVPARARRVFTVEEAKQFLTAARTTRYGTVFALALTTGLRPSEYLGLHWSDIDWVNQTVTVARTLEKGRGWCFSETKRPTSRRQVRLQGWVTRLLANLYAAQKGVATEPIFRTSKGRPINSDYLARHLQQILAAAELPRIRLYDLRHAAASLALAAGVPPKVIAEQLGHAHTAFTLDVYAHLLPHMQAEAAQRMEALLEVDSLATMPARSVASPSLACITAKASGFDYTHSSFQKGNTPWLNR